MDKELAKDDKVEERMDIGNNENAVNRKAVKAKKC